MPDYKESAVTGTAWQRCHQIVIDNRRGVTPTVRFDEEQVVALSGGRELRTEQGTLAIPFDPAKVIALMDPVTGMATGQSTTYGAAYALLYSAYLAAALARDAAAPAEPSTPV